MTVAYRRWVKELPCAVCGFVPCDAHHVRDRNAGMGQKPDDKWCVPLCHKHHMELHNNGKTTFAKKYQVDLSALAEYLWSRRN